jgi:hypothetical protein
MSETAAIWCKKYLARPDVRKAIRHEQRRLSQPFSKLPKRRLPKP